MWVLGTAIASGLLLIIFVLLFQAENARGQRLIFSSWRNRGDKTMERHAASFLGVKRTLGASSLRLFFHYLLHQFLSFVIFVTRFAESTLSQLRAKNKIVAKVIKDKNHDSHLARIAEHKDATALSTEERLLMKERSLQD